MNWKYAIAIVVTGGLAAAGYAIYKYVDKQKKLLEDYSISLIKLKVGSLSEDLLSIYFTIRITNKSSIEATTEKLYADIYVNEKYVGNLVNEKSFVVPAKGTNDVNMVFTLANKELLKNAVSTILTLIGTPDIPYKLKGYVKLKSGGLISVSVPFDYSGGIKSDALG